MVDLEQAKLDIAKAIYIERIVNTDNHRQSLSENEIAQRAISSAEIFIQEWEKLPQSISEDTSKGKSESKVLMSHAFRQ